MRALALFSGGLDSMIAMKLITNQGIDVKAININIGFGGTKDMSAVFRERALAVGADFEMIDAREEYLQKVLFSPKYGYGKRFNPCIDCHAFMMRKARELLEKEAADFIITGEVLGQRPMSQNSKSLKNVLELGDDDGIILRPMSAKLLAPTKPEINGWVDREKLLDIEGRDRKRQLALAQEFGFSGFASPGGGCLLTDINFSEKLRDFVKYQPLYAEDIALLKVGRHFRLEHNAKLVLGRNEGENKILKELENSAFSDIYLGDDLPAPYGKISQNAVSDEKIFAAKLTLFYTKIEKNRPHKVQIADELFEVCAFESVNDFKRYAVGAHV
ncbi:MAG: argininosuccinate synthase [Campylobacteraceae bacterium]|jgi:tRNA-specific 2-thiouridylase|nr:argininosuccinate synthase [Campylobacteraceae bacterium]